MIVLITAQQVRELAKSCGLEPRDYQSRIVSTVYNSFINKHKSVLIESPTGSGKTPMGLLSLRLLKETHPNMVFGWVAMRRKLLAQAREENKRIGVKNIHFVSMFDKNPPKCDMLVTDEAQHDAAATMATLHKVSKSQLSLGMTATPFRTDRIKLSYEKVISDCGVRFLIEEGYLSPFDQYAVPKWEPKHVAYQLVNNPQKWGKSVVFFKNKRLCSELKAYLDRYKIPSAVMLGSDPMSKREEIFDMFDSGAIQVLINIQLLTEGFDCPELRTVWVRDSGKLCTMQMAGRVLRKDPDDPSKVAQVVQSAETKWPYPRCVNIRPRRQFVWIQQGQWRSIEPSEKVKTVIDKVRNNVLNRPIQLPAYMTGAAKRVCSVRVMKDGKVKTTTVANKSNDDKYLSLDTLKGDKG